MCLLRYFKLSLDLSESRKSLKWPLQAHASHCCFGITLLDYLKEKKARSNIYVTSHICSCNYFPVGCFRRRRKTDRTDIQQWMTIHPLEISRYSEGGRKCGTQLILSVWLWGQQGNQLLGFESVFTDHSPGKESLEPCELPKCIRSPIEHDAKVTCQAERWGKLMWT